MEDIQKMNDVAKETMAILKYTNIKLVEKIPIKLINELTELAKKSNKNVIIEKDKKLKEQNISEDSKDLLSLIYYDYIAEDLAKKEILNEWSKNEKIYQESLIKFEPEKIFNDNKTTNLPVKVEKNGIIKRIYLFIKKILKRN